MTPREAIEPYLEHMHPEDASSVEAVFAQVSAAVDFEVNRVADFHEYPAYGYGRGVRMTFEPDDFRGGRPSLDLIVEFQPPRFRSAVTKLEHVRYELEWTYALRLTPARMRVPYLASKIIDALSRVLSGDLVVATGCDLYGEPESANARYDLYAPNGSKTKEILRYFPRTCDPSNILIYSPMTIWPTKRDLLDLFVVARNDVRKYAPKFFEENCLSTDAG